MDEREHTVEQWKELIYQEVLQYEARGSNNVDQGGPECGGGGGGGGGGTGSGGGTGAAAGAGGVAGEAR